MLARIALALIVAAPTIHAADAPFKLHDTWKLGGEGTWDYLTLDSAAHILYIARLNRVMLIDTTSGKLITEIKSLQHVHGIALAPGGKLGYITDGGAGTVIVFDRATHVVTATIPAGKNPDSILVEPTQNRLFVFNGKSKDATVIDAVTNNVLATLPMPGKPEFSVTDQAGNVYVNIDDPSVILRIDAATLRTTATWPLKPAEGPSGLAIDIKHHRLFSVCDNGRMAILDSTTGKVIATPVIGGDTDAAVYDSSHDLVFSSSGESGTVTILHPSGATYATLQTLTTKPGARTMAVDPTTGAIYTVSASLGPKPPASPSNPKRRPVNLPGSFVVLVYSR